MTRERQRSRRKKKEATYHWNQEGREGSHETGEWSVAQAAVDLARRAPFRLRAPEAFDATSPLRFRVQEGVRHPGAKQKRDTEA